MSFHDSPRSWAFVAKMVQIMVMHVRSQGLLSRHDFRPSQASQQAVRAVLCTPCTAVTHTGDTWRSFGTAASQSQFCTPLLRCRAAQTSPPTPRSGCRSAVASPAVSAAQSGVSTDSPAAAAATLQSWLAEERGLPAQGASPQSFEDGGQAVLGFAVSRFFSTNEVTPSPSSSLNPCI